MLALETTWTHAVAVPPTNATPKGAVLASYDGCSERASTTPEGDHVQHAHLVDDVDSCSSRITNTTPKGPVQAL